MTRAGDSGEPPAQLDRLCPKLLLKNKMQPSQLEDPLGFLNGLRHWAAALAASRGHPPGKRWAPSRQAAGASEGLCHREPWCRQKRGGTFSKRREGLFQARSQGKGGVSSCRSGGRRGPRGHSPHWCPQNTLDWPVKVERLSPQRVGC